jgi:hypothetical protein
MSITEQQCDDFAAECRVAFLEHCATRAKYPANQPGHRLENSKRRNDIGRYIDDALDQYNDWMQG